MDRGVRRKDGFVVAWVLPAAWRVSSAHCVLFSEATEASPSGEKSLQFGRVNGINSTISRTRVHEVGAFS